MISSNLIIKISLKLIIAGFFCSLLLGCAENGIVEKEIQYKDARITWYFRSLGNRRDYVEVTRGSQHEIVMDCIGMRITDINIVNDSLVIKMHELAESDIYKFKDNGLGIPVRIDPWATQNEFNKVYNPKFYKPGEK